MGSSAVTSPLAGSGARSRRGMVLVAERLAVGDDDQLVVAERRRHQAAQAVRVPGRATASAMAAVRVSHTDRRSGKAESAARRRSPPCGIRVLGDATRRIRGRAAVHERVLGRRCIGGIDCEGAKPKRTPRVPPMWRSTCRSQSVRAVGRCGFARPVRRPLERDRSHQPVVCAVGHAGHRRQLRPRGRWKSTACCFSYSVTAPVPISVGRDPLQDDR